MTITTLAPTLESTVATDWRFISFAAAALGDADLAARYAADPRSVLAEQGIELAAGEIAPALPAPLDVTELTTAGALRADALVDMCFSGISTGRNR